MAPERTLVPQVLDRAHITLHPSSVRIRLATRCHCQDPAPILSIRHLQVEHQFLFHPSPHSVFQRNQHWRRYLKLSRTVISLALSLWIPVIRCLLPQIAPLISTVGSIRIGMTDGIIITIVLRTPKLGVIMSVNQSTARDVLARCNTSSLIDMICLQTLGRHTSWCKDRHPRLSRHFLGAITLPSRVCSPEEERDGECGMQWSRRFCVKRGFVFKVTCRI